MTPRERIYAIRLMERMKERQEFFDSIGVDIQLHIGPSEGMSIEADE